MGLKLQRNFVCGDVQNLFFNPIDAKFASGLICILVHCSGLLLLLLAGLNWPDKTWSFKKFEDFAVLPLLVFFMYSYPFSFLGFLLIFPPQVLFRPNLFCVLPIPSLFLFCPFCPPCLCASFWCLLNAAIEVGEFG